MVTKIKMLAGEHWWGGTSIRRLCPLSETSEYRFDFRKGAPNQTMPLYVSDKGRYLWSEVPFRVDVSGGEFTFEGSEIALTEAGNTLREAYLTAQKEHFPCDGVSLREEFFCRPQFNSWIEFAYYPTQEKVLRYAHEIVDNGYAPGIFIIDEGWHQHTDYGHWEFDFSRFPDPKAMVRELHDLGFIVMLWVVPFVNAAGPRYVRSLTPLKGTDPESAKHIYKRTDTGEVAIVNWWNGNTAILDMTSPYDREFLDNQLQHLMEAYGIDGFKFDGGGLEHYASANVINGSYSEAPSAGECNRAWNEFGRKYPFHEYKDTFKGGGRNCIQRLHDRNHSWTDDGINDIVPCAILNGLIGHPFICPDMIGGGQWLDRYDPNFELDEELFVRMAECSALFPMMQFSWAPWEALGEENQATCLKMAKLHEAMAEELIALVRKSEISGEPIIRNLEYNDPGKGYAEIDDEFMVGTDILVAPVVTKGTRERQVTFPAGTWQDEKGRTFAGGSTCLLEAPLDTLLWFRRVN